MQPCKHSFFCSLYFKPSLRLRIVIQTGGCFPVCVGAVIVESTEKKMRLLNMLGGKPPALAHSLREECWRLIVLERQRWKEPGDSPCQTCSHFLDIMLLGLLIKRARSMKFLFTASKMVNEAANISKMMTKKWPYLLTSPPPQEVLLHPYSIKGDAHIHQNAAWAFPVLNKLTRPWHISIICIKRCLLLHTIWQVTQNNCNALIAKDTADTQSITV